MEGTVDKINHKRGKRMRGQGPDKLFKLEIKEKYLDKRAKEEAVKNVFDINKIGWRGLIKREEE